MPQLPTLSLGQELYEARQRAYDDNIGYIIGWFKLMNIEPTANNLIANIDEIRAYIAAPDKKNHWEIDRVGTGIQWRFLIRAIGSIDADDIVERVQLLQSGSISIDTTDPFTGQPVTETANVTEFQQIVSDTNPIFITSNGTYAVDNTYLSNAQPAVLGSVILASAPYVDAWFKGMNLQPNLTLARKFSRNIFTYIENPRKEIYSDIVQGSFI
jgi:hypothetical protein